MADTTAADDRPVTLADLRELARRDAEQAGKTAKKPPADALIDAAFAAGVDVFQGEEGDRWALVSEPSGRGRLLRLGDEAFAHWLTLFARRSGLPSPSRTVVQTACGVFHATAASNPDPRRVYVRVAEVGGRVYLDLADRDGTVVEVGEDGWRVTTDCPALFYRPDGTHPLPRPVRDGADHELLWKYVNAATGRDRDLILAWILGAWRTRGAMVGLLVTGERGRGKTTGCSYLRRVVDPRGAHLLSMSLREQDLVVAAAGTHLLAFDNVNSIDRKFVSLLCQVGTGGALSVRTLFTTNGVTTTSFKRPMLVNTAQTIINNEELRDRFVAVEFAPIKADARRDLGPMDAAFEADLPRLLGGLLNVYAAALAGLEDVGPPFPRNADFARLGEAALRSLGRPRGTMFQWVHDQGYDQMYAEFGENWGLVTAIEAVAERNDFRGTTTELLAALRAVDGVDPDCLPDTPAAFGRELARVRPKLSRLGVVIVTKRDRDRGQVHILTSTAAVAGPEGSTPRTAPTPSAEPAPATAPDAESVPASDPTNAA